MEQQKCGKRQTKLVTLYDAWKVRRDAKLYPAPAAKEPGGNNRRDEAADAVKTKDFKLVIKVDLKESLKVLSDLFKDMKLPALLERRIIEGFLYANETVSEIRFSNFSANNALQIFHIVLAGEKITKSSHGFILHRSAAD